MVTETQMPDNWYYTLLQRYIPLSTNPKACRCLSQLIQNMESTYYLTLVSSIYIPTLCAVYHPQTLKYIHRKRSQPYIKSPVTLLVYTLRNPSSHILQEASEHTKQNLDRSNPLPFKRFLVRLPVINVMSVSFTMIQVLGVSTQASQNTLLLGYLLYNNPLGSDHLTPALRR